MSFVTSRRLLIAGAVFSALLPVASQAETPLNVAVVSRTVFYLPAWMAQKKDFFKAEGLDVTVNVYDSSDPIFQDLRAGKTQIAIASTESVIADAYKGGAIRIVAGNSQRPPHFIIAQPGIKTLADLKGKLMGVVSMHEGTTFFVPDIEKKAGLKAGEIKVEASGGSPARAKLLLERKIDAGMQPYPLSYEGEAKGLTNLGPVADIVPDYEFSAVMIDENWAHANTQVLTHFLRALRQGTAYMFAHPDEAAELAATELHTTVPYARRAIDDTVRMDILSKDLSLRDASLRRVFDNVKSADLIGNDSTYQRDKFVDESYLKASAQ
ncbi:MAG TPA: ABC transporter substrate-binding protein [Xanthobacteraceae bacterium]|jgi:ABC-type nitrate/sulfonate/bicarbonate transport system substrate-binding protein|nr:ABC transporter substrate-binding protein [Xanthobacteraceae bacterium]